MIIQSFLTNGLLLLLTYDALLWSSYLFRHSRWLKKHPQAAGYCDRISYCMLAMASVMTGIFLTLLSLTWLWYKTKYGYNPYCYFIIISMNTSIIHLFALLAHCTSLDTCYWPPISNFVSNRIVTPIKNKYGNCKNQRQGGADVKTTCT